jgi:hypothetical protein
MASRGSTRLSQPHAGLIDVDKLDAGLFERRASIYGGTSRSKQSRMAVESGGP